MCGLIMVSGSVVHPSASLRARFPFIFFVLPLLEGRTLDIRSPQGFRHL
jgi:hypothetical protein